MESPLDFDEKKAVLSDKPYYKEPIKETKIRKVGFTTYFWIGFAVVWSLLILYGVNFAYHDNILDGLIQVNNNYDFPIQLNNTNYNNNTNIINVDPPTINTTNNLIVNNIINNTNST